MSALPHILSFYDLILTPIYFLILLAWIIFWKKKYYHDSPYKKYILPAFVIKVICCILLALLYEFYYGFGDPHNYYTGAVEIWNATKENPLYGLDLVFKPINQYSLAEQEFATHISYPAFSVEIVNIFKVSGFIGMFCFGTYLPIALFISFLSFIGSWKIFIVFAEEFPTYYKQIALTCLFVPSFVFWSTNILKDPLCIYGLGLSVSALYNLMKRRYSFLIILQMFAGAFVMFSLKKYIFFIFCIAGFFSVGVHLISNSTSKFLMRLGVFFLLLLLTIWWVSQKDYLFEIFSFGIMQTVTAVQNVQKDQGGSVYVITNVDSGNFFGIIRTYLQSLNVALFRPYFWESSSAIVFANALESFVVLLFTVYLLIKSKIIGFFTFAFKNRVLTFALVFTLLLAPLAGLISFNFGTLVRYKAPVVPFYYTYLILLYYKTKEKANVNYIKS